jgi:hypothetical protein
MSSPKIVNFTIYGERSSGTVFLEEAITKNFDLPVIWYYDWKHFFGTYDFDTDNANVGEEGNAIDNTIFIGIVREPVAWLHSFSKNLQYVPECNHPLTNFLNDPFYSAAKDGDQEIIIQEDVNYITKERFKNIFELRKIKNDFLMNVVRTKVSNYVLITYENLLNDYDNTLDQIKNAFNLVKTHDEYEKIVNHTNGAEVFTGERTIDFSRETIDDIWSKLDVAQEAQLGYSNPFLKPAKEPALVEPALVEPLLEPVKELEIVEPVLEPVKEPELTEPAKELEIVDPVLEPAFTTNKVMHTKTLGTAFKHFVGIVRTSELPIVKRNYAPVTKFVNAQITQIKNEDNPVVAPTITRVIPNFTPLFKNMIAPKQIVKDKATAVKYKKGAFFQLAR